MNILFQNAILLIAFVALSVFTIRASANECWKTPDGKEVCDQPKPSGSQFTFKESSHSIDPKDHYEENHSVDKDYFPQAALKAARDNESRELKRVEAAEKASIEDREVLELKKRNAMEEIQRNKLQIADHRRQQEKMSEEMELMKNELINIQTQQNEIVTESSEVEKKLNSVVNDHGESSKNLRASQARLGSQADSLRRKRLETEAKVSKMRMEMQQALTQIARDQSLIARAETEKAQYEAQEIHVANQLSVLIARRKEIGEERERTSYEIAQLKKRLNAVKDDYNIAKNENDVLEKEVKILTAKLNKDRVETNTEIQGLERKILSAKDSKFKNEGERTRLLAESERMKSQLVEVQKRYDKVAAEEAASNIAVMESRVEVETTKSELYTKQSGVEDLQAHGKTAREQIRNIAALAESSEILETQQKVKVVKACKVFSKPENSNDYNGRLTKGSIIVAAPAPHGFYKVLNTSGTAQFVYQTCVEVVD